MTEHTAQRPAARRPGIGRTDLIVGGTVSAAIAIIVLGFATPSAHRPETATGHDTNSFADDLRACRFMKGGPATQRNRAEPSDAYIAGCLRRRGWAPDGAPTLESVLRD